MSSILDVLKSALENRRDDIVNDVNLTNDIVIDDVMCSLGYNMKRDRAVRRIYNSVVDWEVNRKDGEKCFIVKTIALGQDITDDDLDAAFKYGEENEYPFVVVANGEKFKVYTYFNYEHQYLLVNELDIDKEETEQLTSLFESMKKTTYNKGAIYKLFYENYLDELKVKAMLMASIDNIIEIVDNNVGLYDTEKLRKVTEKLLSADHEDDVVASSELIKANEEFNRLNDYLVELTEERDRLFSEKEELNLKLIERLENEADTTVEATDNSELDAELQLREESVQNREKEVANKAEEIAAREEELATLENNLAIKEKDLSLREEELINREKELEAINEANTQEIISEQEDDEDDFLGLGDKTNNVSDISNEESEKIKKENEELRIKIVELETSISVLNKEIKNTLDELLATKTELTKLKESGVVAEKGESSLLNEELVAKIRELEAKEESMTAYNSQLISKIGDLEYKLTLVDNPEAYADEKIKELENERNALEANKVSLLKSVEDFKKAKDEAEERENKYRFEAEDRIQKLRDRIKKLEDESNFRSYEQQINDLTEERDTALEDIKRLNRKVAQLTQELDELSGGELMRANELLDMIIVAPGQPDTFAGVVNTELYQNQDLRRFVGASLQKLHTLKLNAAFDYIWDGDMFTLKQTDIKDSPHCILSGKGYNISNEDLTPLEAFSKLKVIYSHFDDIVFECRLVQSTGYKNIDTLKTEAMREEVIQSSGLTLQKDTDSAFEQYEETSFEQYNEEEFVQSGEEDFTQNINTEQYNMNGFEQYPEDSFSQNSDFNNYNEELQSGEEYFGDNSNNYTEGEFEQYPEDSLDQYSEDGFAQNEEYSHVDEFEQYSDEGFETNESYVAESNEAHTELNSKLYVTELLSYQDLMMTDRDIRFDRLRFIGTDTSAFELVDNSNLDKVLSKCIDAILSIDEFNGTKAVANIKNIDFNNTSKFIYRFTPDMCESAKITGTKFCISGLNDLYDLVETLCLVCEKLGVNMQSWFVYLDGRTNDSYFEAWETSETAVGTIYILEPDNTYVHKESAIVIKGLIVNNTVITKNSLDYRCKLFGKSLGIKTEYMSQKVSTYEDYLESLRLTAQKAIDSGKSFEDLAKCMTIDGQNSIMSDDINNVREPYNEIIVSGRTMYVSKIYDWEQAETAVRMHVALFANNKIAVKTIIDNGYYEFLRDQFFTSEPSLELAIASLINYIESANSK